MWTASEPNVRDYLLDPQHPDGASKARFFLARSFSRPAWRVLAAALEQHPVSNPVENRQHTPYGLKLTVRCQIKSPDGSNPCILTVWMAEPGIPARLLTAYPSGH